MDRDTNSEDLYILSLSDARPRRHGPINITIGYAAEHLST